MSDHLFAPIGSHAPASAITLSQPRADSELIAEAHAELKAAMKAGDEERLKRAVLGATTAVAKGRASGRTFKQQHVLRGGRKPSAGGGLGTGAAGTEPRVAEVATEATHEGEATLGPSSSAMSEEEKLHMRFHELATSRKSALASRGYEVQDVFIDELYELAKQAAVPPAEWGDFLRLQIPSPGEEEEPVGSHELEVTHAEQESLEQADKRGVRPARTSLGKLRTAIKTVSLTSPRGWRSNVKALPMKRRCSVVAAAPLMERPDDMPINDLLYHAGPEPTAAPTWQRSNSLREAADRADAEVRHTPMMQLGSASGLFRV